jgi:hypothetical protein
VPARVAPRAARTLVHERRDVAEQQRPGERRGLGASRPRRAGCVGPRRRASARPARHVEDVL